MTNEITNFENIKITLGDELLAEIKPDGTIQGRLPIEAAIIVMSWLTADNPMMTKLNELESKHANMTKKTTLLNKAINEISSHALNELANIRSALASAQDMRLKIDNVLYKIKYINV